MTHAQLPDAGRIPHFEIDRCLPTDDEKNTLRGSTLTTFYFGDPNTNGSWRIHFDGTDLLVQVRTSGTWTTQARFTP